MPSKPNIRWDISVGNTLRGSIDCLAGGTSKVRLWRPGVPREGDGGRVDGRERGGVPGSENWES
jgi:hypothetical protein